MIFSNLAIRQDINVPGTTVLVDHDPGSLGLKSSDEVVLIPQPSSDPNDPLNWSMWRKQLHFWILFVFALVLAASSNFQGPLYKGLSEIYDRTLNQLNAGLGTTSLFLAFSCLLCQPIAARFGRRIVYLSATLLSLLSGIVFSGAFSYGGYIGNAVLMGIAAGPIDSLVEVSITDIFFLHQHGKYVAIYALTLGWGSAFGPFIAGYVAENLSIKWCGWLIAIISGALLVVELPFLEESVFQREIDPQVEERLLEAAHSNVHDETVSTRKLEVNIVVNPVTGVKPFKNRLSLWKTTPSKRPIWNDVIDPIKTLRHPAVLWVALAYGIQICWLSLITVTESEFFMAPPYNFGSDTLGLLNLAMVIGSTISAVYSSLSDKLQIWMTKANKGIFEPEFRLLMISIPLALNIAGIFMYGLGPYYKDSWVVGALGIVFISVGLGSITSLTLTYVIECYPQEVGDSMSAILFVRNLISALFAWVFQYWLSGVGVLGTTIMLAVFCVVINGFFIVFFIWGKNFRKWSHKC
ncbi:hypothetical protein KL949_004252 [Ogataea haglerorum]|nr:hypothetical protein KL913_004338 [Ogataea haglerorum]KAG7715338.1 hypothetical protein KL949_004252 [Ogataea haglerorum]